MVVRMEQKWMVVKRVFKPSSFYFSPEPGEHSLYVYPRPLGHMIMFVSIRSPYASSEESSANVMRLPLT